MKNVNYEKQFKKTLELNFKMLLVFTVTNFFNMPFLKAHPDKYVNDFVCPIYCMNIRIVCVYI